MKRNGPIRIEYWCDGCTQIKYYQNGYMICEETGSDLSGLSSIYYSSTSNYINVIPTPKDCPFLLKKERKDKINKLNENW